MHLQSLSSPHSNLSPTIHPSFHPFFIPFLQKYPNAQLVPKFKFKNRFYRVSKRVSESPIVLRNHGGLVGIRCEGSSEKDDSFYMRRCVEIAKKAIGCTSPNPMVGCVIVKDGVVVGEGFHPKAGQPHAEVFAVRDAGDLAENATAYVSLEPCNHYGRTPPCTEALIQAKVKRVVVGMVDPNPIVASKGVERLKEAGIDVTVGVEEELCKKLNEAYIHHMLTGKPFVTLRYSLSVNGRLSNLLGEGAKECGGYYSQLLQENDGIIMSSASVTGNSSLPISQEPQAKQPMHIIVATFPNYIQIPPLTTDAISQVIIFREEDTMMDPDIAQQGIETVKLDRLQLETILDLCGERGLCSVVMDLQGNFGDFEELFAEGIQHGLFQKVVMELLPLWDNDSGDTSILNSKNLEEKVLRLKKLESRILKESVVVDGYF